MTVEQKRQVTCEKIVFIILNWLKRGTWDQGSNGWDQKCGIWDHSPGIRNHKPWERDHQFFVGSGIKLYHFCGIRDQEIWVQKLYQRWYKHTSLRPWTLNHISRIIRLRPWRMWDRQGNSNIPRRFTLQKLELAPPWWATGLVNNSTQLC